MTNHDDRDENGDNKKNENGDDDDNAASGLGSDGPIFNQIMTPCSCLDLAEEDRAIMTTAPWLRRLLYLCVGLYLPYKYPINAMVNICHKLLYTKLGVLGLCC